jgi:peptidoglycan/xylan/chitin deacetylase (PgdA/CDA1 family)
MLSVFDYALPYLKDNNIPSVMFLNMSHIVNSTPLISAEVLFLDKSGHLTKFMKEKNITPPAYLNISPQQLIEFRSAQETYYMEQIQAYQGPLATLETIKKWNDSKLIVYGNHLYEHWNSTALTEKEFVDSIRNNSKSLSELNNYIEFFAFPNGQPMSCFTNEYVKLLHNLGLKKVFYSSGGVNSNKNNFLINRIALFEDDNTPYKLFRRFISVSSNKLIQVDTGFNLDKG